MSNSPGNVVIIGGGIIGCSVAYHLALRGIKSTVIERCGIACAASGKAGGFLARDWCDTYQLGTLARRSFDMHASLAEVLPGTDYRRVDTLSVSVNENGKRKSIDVLEKNCPDWVDGHVFHCQSMGTTKSTAQVHPYKLSKALIEAAKQKVGTEVRKATVVGISKTSGHVKVTGVKLEGGQTVPADVVVIAMGPWSGQASKWLGTPPVRGQKATSIILQPEEELTPHALFLHYTYHSGRSESPEVYPRPDGTVYVCGGADKQNLPDDPSQVTVSGEFRDRLVHVAKSISTSLGKAELQTAQACYLPVTTDGLPVIGEIPGVRGAYIASGHSCWGILNAPATGAAIADLIIDGTSHEINISAFNPARLM